MNWKVEQGKTAADSRVEALTYVEQRQEGPAGSGSFRQI
jgi:hypothetical protein